jgi:hypothetical protein
VAPVPQALGLALALARAPSMTQAVRSRSLPHDILILIRIAGGCQETCQQAAKTSGETPDYIKDAAISYLMQVLLHPGADSYRVMGVLPNAPQETLREHMRWLMRWLHPDRNGNWDSVFTQRVLRAWEDLKTPGRRNDYDRSLRS